MKRSVLVAIIVVVVIILAAAAGYVLLKAKTPSQPTMNNMNMPSDNQNEAATAPVATNAVLIQNFAFSPASITVKKGATVTWTNKDSVAHTVTETDGASGPNSGDIAPGASYSFTFTAAGTYHYHCAVHPNMLGTVAVE